MKRHVDVSCVGGLSCEFPPCRRLLGLALAFALPFAACAQEVVVRRCAPPPGVPAVAVRRIQAPAPRPVEGERLFGLAFMPALETPGASWDVSLFRLNLLVGRHRGVYGLDLGVLGGIVDDEMSGLGVSGLFNDVGTAPGAVQVAGAFNHSRWNFSGLQLSAGFCWTEGAFDGLQVALANKAGRLSGLQVGAANFAEKGSGLQIGVVNFSEQLEGVQVGVVNVNRDSSVPVLPVLNFAF